MLFDMHTHLYSPALKNGTEFSETERNTLAQKELGFRRAQKIASCISCGTPEEWQRMQAYQADALLSFGIHPWYSDKYEPGDYIEAFQACSAVGEIGMDSVWCSVSLERQEKVFMQQLSIAADLHKSVILHTKGQERRIAQLIQDFPEKICVHWYSGTIQDLQPYLEKDCYFTLGPDFSVNTKLHRYLLGHLSADRLFLESDGIASIIWAEQESDDKEKKWDEEMNADTGMQLDKTGMQAETFELLPKALRRSLAAAAAEKMLSEEAFMQIMWANRSAFFFGAQNK